MTFGPKTQLSKLRVKLRSRVLRGVCFPPREGPVFRSDVFVLVIQKKV